jgi:hypothetical protein
MNGNVMYDLAMLEIADRHEWAARQRLARDAAKAQRAERKRGRGGRGSAGIPQPGALPAIPDFPHELLGAQARDAVPAQRPEAGRGRHARAGR